MQNATPDAAARLRALDPLEVDLLASLEARDDSLYALVSAATRYRTFSMREVQLLRAGKDPGMVQAALGRWQNILREIKKLADDL
jgi:hypothetical protein